MSATDRKARIEDAKALGRAAYRLARDGEIVGNIITEGEDKRLTEYRHGCLAIDLWRPWRSDADQTEFSKLRVIFDGVRVLELRWSRAGTFNIVKIERGEWERDLVRYLEFEMRN